MLVDTQPATYQHEPASDEVRDEWVDSHLISVVMDGMLPSIVAAVVCLPILVYLMSGEVPNLQLGVWTVCMALMVAYRYRMVDVYRLQYDHIQGPQRVTFVRRYLWSWMVMGVGWALTILLTYQNASVGTQFVCGLVVLGQGMWSLSSFSAFLPPYRAYANALLGTVLLSLIVNTLPLPWDSEGTRTTVFLVLLLMVFWWMLIAAGNRLHLIHRSSFELQFSNQELIDSLTLQTQAALRAVATKNRFLASAAHDLRQPVHALSLYADWLSTEPEMAREISPRILQSTRAINELFDSLFDLTRIDAGNYKVRLQQVDVPTLFSELYLQFEPVAAGKSLDIRACGRPTTIWSDPVVLRRILGNLLSNALRHTQRGGVLLGMRRREGVLMFEVWDTGVGIAREHQQAIFQEFFRVSQHQGTEDSLGLGLTIVSKLSTLMGYQLALSSEVGRGSVFRVMLPAFTQQIPPEGEPAQAGDAETVAPAELAAHTTTAPD